MRGDPRHTLAGTLAPIGACIVVSLAIATDSEFGPVVRGLWLTLAIATIIVAAVYLRRELRSRGRRTTRRNQTDRGSGG